MFFLSIFPPPFSPFPSLPLFLFPFLFPTRFRSCRPSSSLSVKGITTPYGWAAGSPRSPRQNEAITRLNGLRGTISEHPKEGHPTFIRKAAAPLNPQLTLCVELDEPDAGEKLVLLEPRFLMQYDQYMENISSNLGKAIADMGLVLEARGWPHGTRTRTRTIFRSKALLSTMT